jgi:hypothetical protein
MEKSIANEKKLEKKMTYNEAKRYASKSNKWRIICIHEIQESLLVGEDWVLVDEVKVYKKGHALHHELFPKQEYPAIFKKVNGKIYTSEGNPNALYAVIMKEK